MEHNILVINPGSTSDDIGYYKGPKTVFEESARYSQEELDSFAGKELSEQIPLRRKFLLDVLKKHEINLNEIDAVIGRGGLLKHIEGGIYTINEAMLADLKRGYNGHHPSNLGGILAREIAESLGKPCFIADPVVVDEMEPLARYTGFKEIKRKSIFHALNQKRVAITAAKELGKKYKECNFIVMHGGGGVSVGAHKKGKVIDVSDGFEGAGPMTPQRSGVLPSLELVEMCFSGQYTIQELRKKMRGRGGMIAHTGTSDIADLYNYISSGKKKPGSTINCSREAAQEAFDAMIYQISKEIGAMATVLKGDVDAIILTGGLAYNEYLVNMIKERTGFITDKFFVYPGGDEKAALKEAAARALENPEIIKQYK
ncbi:Acetate kinase [Elusimicrobium minutum Pei191]|uniref:Probable butyrate kinase n=1 Tax=Elusimicrobium minutum (strain Pei191) TaxID=445932 RepID=BUK_ELUMP|nr:butyrate kinase [Elusimicrobium minutum]B2KEH0.1 RecName: Full=Probable butyrate kinase; Short=BK; AltName: Full=Branched-chain carboxylic acid kinase [Elusimicrobium minutum Pei191]ACC98916.1 Acetate kinase [Elusimicrobium minutum Pei191]